MIMGIIKIVIKKFMLQARLKSFLDETNFIVGSTASKIFVKIEKKLPWKF